LFGDGAAATIMSIDGVARIGEFVLGIDGSGANNLMVKMGGARHSKPLQDEDFDADGYILTSDHLYMNG